MVVLTDEDSLAATKQLFKQVGFLVIPLSILLIRFYSDWGRVYNPWDGTLTYTGVTTNKNQLGMICLIYGLAAAWRILEVVRVKRWARNWGTLVANGIIVATGLWLIRAADSMTPFACFALAGGVMVACSLRSVARKPWLIHLLVVSVLAVAFSALFLGIGSGLVQNLGRDSTLTGRTDIWNLVLPMTPSALLGAGYENFWTGGRLQKIWSVYWNHPNQAHNGYIEIYLNLGWIGVILLALVIITAYRKVVAAVRRRADAAPLRLAYFIVAVAYNFTEAAFKMTNPVWIVFLLATTFVPEAALRTGSKLKVPVKMPAPLAELPVGDASA
jgi:O-antigen ligase